VTLAYYSLLCDPHGVHERQWARSVRSLRRHNPDLDVALCLYGEARPETLATADRWRVEVVRLGEYGRALGDLPAHWRAALTANPTLHKLPSLRPLEKWQWERLVYVDCDTYFFGEVGELTRCYDDCDLYAREEPMSGRSGLGYDSSYLDEALLWSIARAEGLTSVPPYNTGVLAFSRRAVTALAGLLEDFAWYAWRLLLGACRWRPEMVADKSLLSFVLSSAGPGELQLAIPLPTSNFWILEEVATWLTLGRIPPLTHDTFAPGDVAQGHECLAGGAPRFVAHYFTVGEPSFLARLGGEQ
jgi:hypothetical protein